MSSREVRARGPKKSKRIPRSHFFDNTRDQQVILDTDASLVVSHGRRPRPHFSDTHDQQVLTFREWCALNNISPKTGRRILKAPDAPTVTMLTKKLIGITIGADRAWKESRRRPAA
jgi:hypothetical protein